MTLRITAARAKELEALDEAATPGPWRDGPVFGSGQRGIRAGEWLFAVCDDSGNARCMAEGRNALRDFLTDRAALLDALRRAARGGFHDVAEDCEHRRCQQRETCADLRALLASAEGGSDGNG